MKTSNIFDIKRFAIHDGDGLRTTVFFKGCPLRCKWCQNPEGLSSKPRPIWFENSCIHCRLCEKAAKENQMVYKDRPYFNLSYDGDFGNLVKVCPSAAIRYDSKEYTVDELVTKIKEDKVFFRDNGGVTFSGGEPFNQGEFLVEVLKKCKEENIHTAIESSFYADRKLIEKCLPYLDLIYADIKLFDKKRHVACTDVSNQIILENIRYLLTSEHKSKVIIRTPLIPTMNADDENIEAISKFIYELDTGVKYELLNYNPLASSKYELVDLNYELKDIKPFSKDEMNHFYKIVTNTGIKNLIKE